jgi:hypothetical protein
LETDIRKRKNDPAILGKGICFVCFSSYQIRRGSYLLFL